MDGAVLLIVVGVVMFTIIGGISVVSHIYNLNGIKSKTVGDGQHGTARFLTKSEQKKVYQQIPFNPTAWRKHGKDKDLKLPQGVIVGCKSKGGQNYAMVDTFDVHTMMIGAAGCGKTAYWLYPNLEYACASGMSFLTTDTKGDCVINQSAKKQQQLQLKTILQKGQAMP